MHLDAIATAAKKRAEHQMAAFLALDAACGTMVASAVSRGVEEAMDRMQTEALARFTKQVEEDRRQHEEYVFCSRY